MDAEFAETWSRKAVRYLPNVLSIAGNVASIIALVVAYFVSASPTIFSIYIVSVATMFGAVAIWQEYRYARKAAYSEVFASTHYAVHTLRDMFDMITSQMSEEQLARNLQGVVDAVSRAFSVATRTNCRACIKVICASPTRPDFETLALEDRTRHLQVRTLVRDAVSKPLQVKEIADFLSDNTDFFEIFVTPGTRVFFDNNLQRLHKGGRYYNSHIPRGWDRKRSPWPLPYRSTMVWPIRKARQQSEWHSDQEILGYLCVDSLARNVFFRRYDFDVGALVADALYLYMKAYFRATQTPGGR